ncbi:MAG: hypothetical protein E7111_05620 [Bacteroidales bacterium]|nr:hypothetical protein [Bacteroidales bacterium]
MIISLTGFMGCGKSSVGRALSKLLCCPFMDLDAEIETRSGRTIPEIFEADGEKEFRRIEKETLKDILETGGRVLEIPKTPALPTVGHPLAGGGMSSPSSSTPACKNQEHPSNERPQMILALGGGAVMTPACERMVHRDTVCVYLRASVDTLIEHLTCETAGRPLLADTAAQRDPHAAVAAQDEVNATSLRGAEPFTSLREAKRRGNPLQERITQLMKQRSSTYERTAHIIIDTDGKSINRIAEELITRHKLQ